MKAVKVTGPFLIITLVSCQMARATMVRYDLRNLGNNQYEYAYSLNNDILTVPIEEFTIWFDSDLYDNLTITTQQPLASQWDEIILEETGFGLPVGYDALALGDGIQPLETLGGFSVRFDWLGAGLPGDQFFEIINLTSFETLDSGYTIPEPSMFILFGLGGLGCRVKLLRPLPAK